ncbi:MAG: hypothetical protein CMB94_00435 [Flammeovirgaceae bacterium]|nr:hypothetical protein [Flammeovirgaceae bacterium]|tara:strand:+ start:29889 stop:30716 length:828 start_codon:yes stop_codon:yes gene_type:complete
MRNKIYVIFFLIVLFSCIEQVSIERQFLPLEINETSGLEYYNKNFLTHNDSGGKPILYEFNKDGKIVSEHTINNCGVNNDWEDITADNENIYVANSGNNFGTRENLAVLVLDKENNFKCKGLIQFRYKRQNNFESRNRHPYDSEGLISVDDELIIFSKDREDLITELYSLPKIPGDYEIEPLYSYQVNSLITGADYSKELKLVALVGYDFAGNQFLYTIKDFERNNLDNSKLRKFKILVGKAQIEAIKIIDESSFWITSEDEGNGFPRLFNFKIN